MSRVTVTALKAFTYEGRAFAAGDPVDMTIVDASIAHRRHEVSLTVRPKTSDQSSDHIPDPQAPARTRRRYRTRQMIAEP